MTQISGTVFLSAAIASACYLIGAILVYTRRINRPNAAQAAVLYLSLAMLWKAGLALQRAGFFSFLDNNFFPDLAAIGLLTLTATFFILTRRMMGYRNTNWRWIVFFLVWLSVFVFASLGGWFIQVALSWGGEWQGWFQTGLRAWLIIGWGFFMIGCVFYSLKTYQQASYYSMEAPYWMGALILILLGDVAWWAGYAQIGDVLHIFGGWGVAYIVSKARLPELGYASRRAFSGAIYATLGVTCYTIGLTIALTLGRSWPMVNPFLLGLVFAALLALLLNPALQMVQRHILERVSGSQDEMTGLLRQYSLSITNTLDLNLLATVVVGTASEFLEIRRGFLYLIDLQKGGAGAGQYAFRGIKGMGDLDPKPGCLRWESPLAEFFRAENQPVTQNQINTLPRFRELIPDERNWLDHLEAGIYAPIYSKDEWIGLLVLGPKGSGKEYTPQDLAFLSTMAGQTAVALENARLVEGLVRLNEEAQLANQALDQANRYLERMDKAKSDFINIVSHELRTPMNLISGASQMLLDEPELQDNPYYKQVLLNLHRGAQRLDKIIESMLDMARIDTRLMVLELQPVVIHHVIRMVHDDLIKSSTARKQGIEIRDLERLPAVMADLPALRKVFYNLVINAIKYTPDGGKITIWGRELPVNEKELPNGGIEVVVSDTGIGIDPSYRDLVFVKFYQPGESALHSSGRTKFKGGGPGLGLAIAHGIVEAHQGKIWVESPGCDEKRCPGSQFHVVLPLRPIAKPESFETPSVVL